MELTLGATLRSLGPDYAIKAGYVHRTTAAYFEDSIASTDGIVHQPDVYPFAAYLARRFGCTHILDIGCGRAQKLIALHPEFQIIGVDHGSNLAYCKRTYPFGTWIEHDLETHLCLGIPDAILNNTVIVCSDVIEHLTHPEGLLQTLSDILGFAPVAIVSTPERDLVRGCADFGPPANKSHVREWNTTEFASLMNRAGVAVGFIGLTNNNDRDLEKKTIVAVLHGERISGPRKAPDSFCVTAIMTSYNEADIIGPSISHLLAQGIRTHVIDNWSSDGTEAALKPLLDTGMVTCERFPPTGPSEYYEWRKLLARVEEVAQELDADWLIHHDVDELRESPWEGITLRDGLFFADSLGFNAVDHTVIDFRPISDDFIAGMDFAAHFLFWEFGRRSGHFQQIKAWKNLKIPVDLKLTGGHEAAFSGRRVFPYKFLLRHYPVRSRAHGQRKVFQERRSRYSPDEKRDGWHIQYDSIDSCHEFIIDRSQLSKFEPQEFLRHYLVERLSGVGILKTPSPTPPRDSHGRKSVGHLLSYLLLRLRQRFNI